MPVFELKCLPSQQKFHQLGVSHPRDPSLKPPKYRAFSGPVGSGKTIALCDHLLHLAYANPGRTGLLGSATYPLLRDAALKTLFERLEEHRIPFRHQKSENTLTLTDIGTRILCRSVENFNRLRGTNLAFFGIDELTYCPENAWLQLEARLRDPKAPALAGCAALTPRGFEWVYRKFIRDPRPEYAAVIAVPFENTFLGADFYPGLLGSYAANFARQEVLGEYLNVFSGRAYDSFSSEPGGNIWRANGQGNYKGFKSCAYRQDRPILWGLDFNVTPAASVIAQTVSHNPKPWGNALLPAKIDTRIGGTDKQLNVLDELYLADTNTERHCEAFYQKIKPKLQRGIRTRVIVYGDPSGNSRQSSASESDYTIIRRFFSRHADELTLETRVPVAHPPVKDRINSVNALCANYNGTRRLAVHERCRELIRDLEEVAWALDTAGNTLGILSTKNPARNHISDGLGYLIAHEFAIRGTVGYKPQYLGL